MKILFSSLIILLGFIIGYSQDLNEPLLVSGRVFSASGDLIDSKDFRLLVNLKDYPEDFLTEKSFSCGYDPPIWFVELGNLPIGWNTGEILTILIEDYQKKERVVYNWVIDSTGFVPDLRTQGVSIEDEIYNFTLSDRGVFNGTPVNFTFNSVFSQITDPNLMVISRNGTVVYESNRPLSLESNKYQFSWAGRTNTGDNLRSGVYFYFLSIGQKVIHSGLISLKNE